MIFLQSLAIVIGVWFLLVIVKSLVATAKHVKESNDLAARPDGMSPVQENYWRRKAMQAQAEYRLLCVEYNEAVATGEQDAARRIGLQKEIVRLTGHPIEDGLSLMAPQICHSEFIYSLCDDEVDERTRQLREMSDEERKELRHLMRNPMDIDWSQ